VFPNYEDSDVIDSCCRGYREGVERMSEESYIAIGKTVVWIATYIFIPLLVSVVSGIWINRKYIPQPKKNKKKRF
jgi:hypothetical protein